MNNQQIGISQTSVSQKTRLVLIASRAHRRGPDSRLIRFVREFELFLNQLSVKATLGAWWSITKCGLLGGHPDFLSPLPGGRQGGLVYVTHEVVKGNVDVVVYFMDPLDPTSLYPEAAALKRECVAQSKFFLSTYASAVEWASLAWMAMGNPAADIFDPTQTSIPERLTRALAPDRISEQTIALIAHNQLKVEMLDFALIKHRDLLRKFKSIVATGTTGGYLNGEKNRTVLIKECEELLCAASDRKEIGKIKLKLSLVRSIDRDATTLNVKRLASGPEGGDVEIAHMVIRGECDKVIFFEDPYTAQPHEADIQVLERTCRLRGEHVVCLSDPLSAEILARSWKKMEGGYYDQPPVTIQRALERYFSTAETRVRVVLADTVHTNPLQTLQNISRAAAWYTHSLIERLSTERIGDDKPIRLALPWGFTVGNLVDGMERVRRSIKAQWRRRQTELDAPCEPRHLVAIPMVGLLGSEDPSREANALAKRVASLYAKGESLAIPSAAYVRADKYTPDLLGEIGKAFAEADIVVITGSPLRTEVSGALGTEVRAPLFQDITSSAASQDSIGDLCGVWLSLRAEPIETPPYKRVGFDWTTLKQIARDPARRVVLLMGGDMRYETLARSLLNAGIVSTLVTDIQFGRRLLELSDTHGRV